MLNYIIRRLLIALPSLLGISLVLFTVLALAPGDPFEELATNPNVPAEVKQMLRQKFGLDDPVWQRYFRWLSAMLQGDWGFSFVSRMNAVSRLISSGANRVSRNPCARSRAANSLAATSAFGTSSTSPIAAATWR